MLVYVDSLSSLFIPDGIDLELRNFEVPFSYINMIINIKKGNVSGCNLGVSVEKLLLTMFHSEV